MYIKKYIIKAVGPFVFIILIINSDLNRIVLSLKHLDTTYYILGLLLFFPITFLKSYRWWFLLKEQRIMIKHKEALKFTFSSIFIATITPGRLGELVKAFYIQKKGYSLGKAFSSTLIDRLFDIATLFIIGILGMLILLDISGKHILSLGIIFLLVFIVLVITVNKKDFFIDMLKNFSIFSKYREMIGNNVNEFIEGFSIYKNLSNIWLILITLLAWFLLFEEMFLFSKALNLNITFSYIALSICISTFISLLPITILGIGSRDLSLVLLFNNIGINQESAIAFSNLILLMHFIDAGISYLGWLTVDKIKD